MVGVGQIIKWAKTTHSAIAASAAQAGCNGIKTGWGALMSKTA